MTLDDAIKHAEEVAEEQEKAAKEWHENQVRKCELFPFVEMDYTHENECKKCADEHRQFAEWLKDYKRLIEQQSCDDCVSRAELLKKYEDRFIELQRAHQQDKQLGVNWCINTLKQMPPVIPTFPKDATNGNLMTAMFPDIKIREHEKTDICDAYIQIDIWDFSICVSKDWWDEPYKRGSENE